MRTAAPTASTWTARGEQLLDDEATYSTRDEITRKLIERVFSDRKKLLAMAKAHIEGAREGLIEYRKARSNTSSRVRKNLKLLAGTHKRR